MEVSKCVGCGYCCLKAPCAAAVRLYGKVDRCPQLKWDEYESRYQCGLMLIPGPIGAGYRKELYAGAGCCCSLNSWRKDVKKRDVDKNTINENPLPKIFQMFLACLGAQFMSGDVIYLTTKQFCHMLVEHEGYTKDDANKIGSFIMKTFKENRHGFMEGFMG